MFRTIRRLRRPLTLLPVALWTWRERHVLAGMVGFAKTVPDRLRLGRGSEVVLAAKVNLALLREARLKGADVRLGAVQGGDVCLEAGSGADAHAEIARRVVERIAGVSSVRIETASAVPAGDAPTVVAGDAEVAGDGLPLRV